MRNRHLTQNKEGEKKGEISDEDNGCNKLVGVGEMEEVAVSLSIFSIEERTSQAEQ